MSLPLYWEDLLDLPQRTFKSADELKSIYEAHGVLASQEVIAYCQVGMRASVDLFALHLIGYDRLRNYYGAWEEWGNRDDLPLADLHSGRGRLCSGSFDRDRHEIDRRHTPAMARQIDGRIAGSAADVQGLSLGKGRGPFDQLTQTCRQRMAFPRREADAIEESEREPIESHGAGL